MRRHVPHISGAGGGSNDRANHTGTQAASTISGLAPVATSGAYSDLEGAPDLEALGGLEAYASALNFQVGSRRGNLSGQRYGADLSVDGPGLCRHFWPVVLGETANAAYPGDRGKVAYDHAQIRTIPTASRPPIWG